MYIILNKSTFFICTWIYNNDIIGYKYNIPTIFLYVCDATYMLFNKKFLPVKNIFIFKIWNNYYLKNFYTQILRIKTIFSVIISYKTLFYTPNWPNYRCYKFKKNQWLNFQTVLTQLILNLEQKFTKKNYYQINNV